MQQEKESLTVKIQKRSKNQIHKNKGLEIRIKVYKSTSLCKPSWTLDSFLLRLTYKD